MFCSPQSWGNCNNFPRLWREGPRTSPEMIWSVFLGFSPVKYVWRDHCHERPPVLKDHILLAGLTFQCNSETVTKDHLSWETIFLWPIGRSFKRGSTVSSLPSAYHVHPNRSAVWECKGLGACHYLCLHWGSRNLDMCRVQTDMNITWMYCFLAIFLTFYRALVAI